MPDIHHYNQLEDWIDTQFGKDKDIVGCEIGVASRAMENHLLPKFPRLVMYGVDPLKSDHIQPRFTYYGEKSDVAVSHFKPDMLDFVYIDGDHEAEQVKRDILNYSKFVKQDGFVAGHDYHVNAHGVKGVVDELFGKGVLLGADLTWFILKKDIKCL